MNLIYLISRKWSADILDQIIEKKKFLNLKIKVFVTQKKFITKKIHDYCNVSIIKEKNLIKNIKSIKKFNPKIIFAYGWSGYINKELRDICNCLILHPSELPKFRGGSPIQNQLVRNINKSAITILLASDKIDSGDILFQKKILLNGYLDDIHNRIVKMGVSGTEKILKNIQKNQIIYYEQDHKKATTFKRRTPAMSEIFIDDFKNYNAKYFYNLIRGLQKPYPECFIRCKNNSILYIQKVSLKKN